MISSLINLKHLQFNTYGEIIASYFSIVTIAIGVLSLPISY